MCWVCGVLESALVSKARSMESQRRVTGFSTRGSCYSGIGYMDKGDKCSPSEVLPPHYLGNRKC